MNRYEDVLKLEREIKDTEIRIRTVRTNIVTQDRDIASLLTLEKTLSDNVGCLKKKQIIAIAQEFKKAKEDLTRTKTRIASLNNNRDDLIRAEKEMVDSLNLLTKELEKVNKSLENNVVQGKFGRKSGQE